MKIIYGVICRILEVLSILYALDYITFNLISTLIFGMINISLNSRKWAIFRWLFTSYIIYRVGLFSWYRYKVYKKLNKKHADVLDKHGRLNEKLKATPNPVVTTEQIEQMSIADMRRQLLSKKFSAVDLIDAYQRRALEMFQRRPGCISEMIFDADVYAILADSRLSSEEEEGEGEGKATPLTPLHGIPVSVQEIFPVRGLDHTMGYTTRTNKPAGKDCTFIAALKEAGAIPFVLTNFRQKLFGLTSENPLFGHTCHPTHPGRACVSGDAALLLCGGSPLSFGADSIGGARLSAAFCGLISFKPTSSRLSQKGFALPLRVQPAVSVSTTPIAHTVENVADALRTMWSPPLYELDDTRYTHPFNEESYVKGATSKMRIGFYSSICDSLTVSPAVERVMSEVRTYLQNQGHEIIDFAPPTPVKAYGLVISLLSCTVQPDILRLVYKEGHGDVMSDYEQRIAHAIFALPNSLKKMVCNWLARRVEKDSPVTAAAIRGLARTESYIELSDEAIRYADQYRELWDSHNIKCLVCPVSPFPVPWEYSSLSVVNSVLAYTALFNILEYPAGTLPVGRVEKADITAAMLAAEPAEPAGMRRMIAEQLQGGEGLPVEVQVVARTWNDEVALGLMKSLEAMRPTG